LKKMNDDLRIAGEMYFDKEAVPQNASKSSVALKTESGAMNASIELRIVVNEALTITEATQLTIGVYHGDSSDAVSTKIAEVVVPAGTVAAKTRLLTLVLPSTAKAYTAVVMESDDVAAAGSIDAYPVHVPR